MSKRVTFKVASAASKDAVPVLANFPGGIPANVYATEDPLTFGFYKNIDALTREEATRRVVAGETDELSYLGANYGDDSLKSSLCKYVIGVQRGETVELYDALSFGIKHKVKRPRVYDVDTELNEADDTRTEAEKYMARRNLLVETFGAKKKKQAVAAAQRNRIDVNELGAGAAAIQTTVQANLANEIPFASIQQEADEERPVPPYNLNATTPHEFYVFNDIITPEEYEALKVPSKLFVKCTPKDLEGWKQTRKYGSYILGQLASLPTNPAEKNKKARSLLYLHYMLKFRDMPLRAMSEEEGFNTDMPDVVKQRLLALFTESITEDGKLVYKMPQRLKDKLVNYVFALVLHIDNFVVHPENIVKDMKLSMLKATDHFRALGCHVSSGKRKIEGEEPAGQAGGKTVTLTMPVSFPRQRMKKGGK
eukprot:Colp12_sorted_trinity150504_noHs@1230